MGDYLLAVSDLSITLKEETCVKSNLFVQLKNISKFCKFDLFKELWLKSVQNLKYCQLYL